MKKFLLVCLLFSATQSHAAYMTINRAEDGEGFTKMPIESVQMRGPYVLEISAVRSNGKLATCEITESIANQAGFTFEELALRVKRDPYAGVYCYHQRQTNMKAVKLVVAHDDTALVSRGGLVASVSRKASPFFMRVFSWHYNRLK